MNLHLAHPKVDDFPFSIQSAILCADMLCFRSTMLVRSFTVNKIRGTRHQPLLHAIRNLFVFVEYCHLLELYVKCAALYRIFIAQSLWNTRCCRPRGRTLHLTRSLVALEGWSLIRDRTKRKHCPSHEIWSYKRDGRWWGWSFDRCSTVWQCLIWINNTNNQHKIYMIGFDSTVYIYIYNNRHNRSRNVFGRHPKRVL